MNLPGKKTKDIDGLADTEMAMSSGAAFERTEQSNRTPARGSGTLTDMGHGARDKRAVAEIQRDERYDVQAEHARGGLGRVLRARDEHLGRVVAIKELLEASNFAESLFIREALITARLQHPGIVPVHEAGRWPSGDPYYVMKLLSGESLQKIIRQKSTLAERLALLPNVLHVVETIAYAHSQGVIHRDIKPANVVVGEFGETVVVDWGLARDERETVPPVVTVPKNPLAAEFSDSGGPSSGSQKPQGKSRQSAEWQVSGNYSVSGKVVGTPAYMSPEQARGDEVDERTDVYALGALMYEVLAGTPPYPGNRLQDILERVLAGPPTPLADVLARSGGELQPDLITIVERAMARDLDKRYASAQELAEDLRRFQTGRLVSVHQYRTFTLVKRWVRKHRAPLFVAAAALVVLGVMAVLSVDRIVDERNAARQQRAEAQRARDATLDVNRELLFGNAERALDTDPTTTLAWLAQISLDDAHFPRALHLAEQAVAMGVSRHVVENDEELMFLTYTPDGRAVLGTGTNGAIVALDTVSGTERTVLETDSVVRGIAISPDGALLAAGLSTGNVLLTPLTKDRARPQQVTTLGTDPGVPLRHIWFAESGQELNAITQDMVGYVFHMPDGALISRVQLVAGSGEVAAPFLYNVGPEPDQVIVRRENGDTVRFRVPANVWEAHVAKSRRRAVAIAQGRMYLLDLHAGATIELGDVAIPRGMNDFPPLDISPSGRYLVTRAPTPGLLLLYDLDRVDGIQVPTPRALEGHEDTVFNFRFTPDERYLISASDDTTVRVWDLDTQDVQVLRGHTDDVYRLVVSPDGKSVISSGRDRTLRVWNLSTPEAQRLPLSSAQGPAAVRFAADNALVTIDDNGEIQRHDLETRQVTPVGKASYGLAHRDQSISRSGRYALAHDPKKGELELWDLFSGEHRVLPDGDMDGAVASVAWAPDDSGFAVLGRANGKARLWRLDTDQAVDLPVDKERCGIALAPASDRIAVLTNQELRLYDTATMSVRASRPLEGARPCGLLPLKYQAAFAPDGHKVAFPFPRVGMLVWNPSDDILDTYPVSPLHAFALLFSDDSSRIASFHQDLSIHLVDLAKRESRRLGYHKDLVHQLIFSPTGDTLATSSYDHTIRLWDTRGDDHRTLRGHSSAVTSVAFAPDGRRLASVSRDRTLRLWDLTQTPARDPRALDRFIDAQTTAIIESTDRARTPHGLH